MHFGPQLPNVLWISWMAAFENGFVASSIVCTLNYVSNQARSQPIVFCQHLVVTKLPFLSIGDCCRFLFSSWQLLCGPLPLKELGRGGGGGKTQWDSNAVENRTFPIDKIKPVEAGRPYQPKLGNCYCHTYHENGLLWLCKGILGQTRKSIHNPQKTPNI